LSGSVVQRINRALVYDVSMLRHAIFGVLWSLLALTGSAARAGEGPSLPKPDFTLVLEKTSLRVRTSVPLHLWVGNSSDVALRDLSLAVRGPRAFTLREGSPGLACPPPSDGARGATEISLGAPLPPHSTLERDLCLEVRNADEADLTLLFVLRFRFPIAAGLASSASTATQLVQVGLLGTETLGGTSLRLVIFFLPGVLALFVLRLFRVPVVADLNATEQGFAAIGLSSLLAALGSRLGPGIQGEGASFRTLLVLCCLGLLSGVFLGLLSVGYRYFREYQRRSVVVLTEDEKAVILRKLFDAARGGNVLVRLKDGRCFIGSCAARTIDGYVLGSWFEVPTPPDPTLRSELERWRKAGEWSRMLRCAVRAKLAIEVRNQVRTRQEGVLVAAGQDLLWVRSDDVVEQRETSEGPSDGPLSFA
jgi:hypothetical protein